MGWGRCGTDSKGREIGYAVSARCDHPDCKAKIDRGLSYACGDWHGTSIGCEGYFCGDHLAHRWDPGEEAVQQFCAECAAELDDQRLTDLLSAANEVAISDTLEEARDIARDVLKRWDEWTDTTPEIDVSGEPA